MGKKDSQNNGKKKIITVLLLVVATVALGVLAFRIANSIMAARANDVLRDVAFAYSDAATAASQEPQLVDTDGDGIPETVEEPVVYVSPVDFVALQRVNPEIYSWIEIPGTVISYPVLQHEGEDWRYYLHHTFDNQYNSDGAVFSQNTQRQNYRDGITVLYGHYLLSRGMFGSLGEYRDLDYMMEHQDVTIYTPYEELHFTVFGAVTYTNALLTYEYDYQSAEGVQAFLDAIEARGNGIIRDDVEVNADSHILVMSTCNGNSSQRYLVLAVLNEDA